MHSSRRIRLGRARQNHTTLGGDAQRRPTCVEHMRRENETGHRALVRRADESAQCSYEAQKHKKRSVLFVHGRLHTEARRRLRERQVPTVF
jgi:hypothetical protein